jgi:hypothetical protein
MHSDRSNRAILYAVAAVGITACVVFIALWARSHWWRDSIQWCYSEAGQFTLESARGTFALGHRDPRFSYDSKGWSWNSFKYKAESSGKASLAGFGWSSHGLSDSNELHIRYWVVVAFALLLSAISLDELAL